MIVQKTLSIAMVLAASACFTATGTLFAAAPTITYTAAGTFSATPVSGADTLKLAGQPFNATIAVSASTKPYKTGSNYAAYNKLKLTGQVYSGLLGSTPATIASGEASIIQAINPAAGDLFTMEAPVKVVGIALTIKAVITMPLGTISKPLLHPFTTVNFTPANTSMSYSDGTNTTKLTMQTGTLTATIPNGTTAGVHRAAVRIQDDVAEPVRFLPVDKRQLAIAA